MNTHRFSTLEIVLASAGGIALGLAAGGYLARRERRGLVCVGPGGALDEKPLLGKDDKAAPEMLSKIALRALVTKDPQVIDGGLAESELPSKELVSDACRNSVSRCLGIFEAICWDRRIAIIEQLAWRCHRVQINVRFSQPMDGYRSYRPTGNRWVDYWSDLWLGFNQRLHVTDRDFNAPERLPTFAATMGQLATICDLGESVFRDIPALAPYRDWPARCITQNFCELAEAAIVRLRPVLVSRGGGGQSEIPKGGASPFGYESEKD